jgi:hypothetical protein
MTKKGKQIATTNDPLGNFIITTDATWKHIQERRAAEGVVMQLSEVQEAISGAQVIRETTQQFPAFGYSKAEDAGGVRVIVAFGTSNLFDGTATGYVSTAYPNDPNIISAVGKIIWSAPAATTGQCPESKELDNQREENGTE